MFQPLTSPRVINQTDAAALLTRTVSENKLLNSLPPDELQKLAPYLETVWLNFCQVLVEFDSPIEYVYFLDTAVTSTVVRTQRSETIEVGLMGVEGFVGLSLLYGVRRSNATVLVQIPGRALRMRAFDFSRALGSIPRVDRSRV